MSLTYEEMSVLIQETAAALLETKLEKIEELADRLFLLTFLKKDQRIQLLISLQSHHLRFHLVAHTPRPHKNRLCEMMMQKIGNATLQQIELLNRDRILCLTLSKHGHTLRLICEFFSKGANLLLIDSTDEILLSWKPLEKKTFAILPHTSSHTPLPSRFKNSWEVEDFYRQLENKEELEQKRRSLLSLLKKRHKKHLQAVQTFQNQLEENRQWEQFHHQAELLQSHFYLLKRGLSSISVPDWTHENQEVMIHLDPSLEPKDLVAKAFQKARKMRKSLPHLEERLKVASVRLAEQDLITEKFEKAEKLEELKTLCTTYQLPFASHAPLQEKRVKTHPFREFISASGLPIYVAKRAVDNDQLTFSFAKGSDWWFHVRNFPGSHVIIKPKHKEEAPDNEAIQDAALLAFHFSKASKESHAEICMTQKKHLARVSKKQPGKVMISKHKVLHLSMDAKRLENILARQISVALN